MVFLSSCDDELKLVSRDFSVTLKSIDGNTAVVGKPINCTLPIYCALHTATRHKKSDNTAIFLITSLIYLYRYILFHWQTVTA